MASAMYGVIFLAILITLSCSEKGSSFPARKQKRSSMDSIVDGMMGTNMANDKRTENNKRSSVENELEELLHLRQRSNALHLNKPRDSAKLEKEIHHLSPPIKKEKLKTAHEKREKVREREIENDLREKELERRVKISKKREEPYLLKDTHDERKAQEIFQALHELEKEGEIHPQASNNKREKNEAIISNKHEQAKKENHENYKEVLRELHPPQEDEEEERVAHPEGSHQEKKENNKAMENNEHKQAREENHSNYKEIIRELHPPQEDEEEERVGLDEEKEQENLNRKAQLQHQALKTHNAHQQEYSQHEDNTYTTKNYKEEEDSKQKHPVHISEGQMQYQSTKKHNGNHEHIQQHNDASLANEEDPKEHFGKDQTSEHEVHHENIQQHNDAPLAKEEDVKEHLEKDQTSEHETHHENHNTNQEDNVKTMSEELHLNDEDKKIQEDKHISLSDQNNQIEESDHNNLRHHEQEQRHGHSHRGHDKEHPKFANMKHKRVINGIDQKKESISKSSEDNKREFEVELEPINDDADMEVEGMVEQKKHHHEENRKVSEGNAQEETETHVHNHKFDSRNLEKKEHFENTEEHSKKEQKSEDHKNVNSHEQDGNFRHETDRNDVNGENTRDINNREKGQLTHDIKKTEQIDSKRFHDETESEEDPGDQEKNNKHSPYEMEWEFYPANHEETVPEKKQTNHPNEPEESENLNSPSEEEDNKEETKSLSENEDYKEQEFPAVIDTGIDYGESQDSEREGKGDDTLYSYQSDSTKDSDFFEDSNSMEKDLERKRRILAKLEQLSAMRNSEGENAMFFQPEADIDDQNNGIEIKKISQPFEYEESFRREALSTSPNGENAYQPEDSYRDVQEIKNYNSENQPLIEQAYDQDDDANDDDDADENSNVRRISHSNRNLRMNRKNIIEPIGEPMSTINEDEIHAFNDEDDGNSHRNEEANQGPDRANPPEAEKIEAFCRACCSIKRCWMIHRFHCKC